MNKRRKVILLVYCFVIVAVCVLTIWTDARLRDWTATLNDLERRRLRQKGPVDQQVDNLARLGMKYDRLEANKVTVEEVVLNLLRVVLAPRTFPTEREAAEERKAYAITVMKKIAKAEEEFRPDRIAFEKLKEKIRLHEDRPHWILPIKETFLSAVAFTAICGGLFAVSRGRKEQE